MVNIKILMCIICFDTCPMMNNSYVFLCSSDVDSVQDQKPSEAMHITPELQLSDENEPREYEPDDDGAELHEESEEEIVEPPPPPPRVQRSVPPPPPVRPSSVTSLADNESSILPYRISHEDDAALPPPPPPRSSRPILEPPQTIAVEVPAEVDHSPISPAYAPASPPSSLPKKLVSHDGDLLEENRIQSEDEGDCSHLIFCILISV